MDRNLYDFTPNEIERSQLLALEIFERLILQPATDVEQLRKFDDVIARADAEVATEYAELSAEDRAGEIGQVMNAYRRSRAAMRAAIGQHVARLAEAS